METIINPCTLTPYTRSGISCTENNKKDITIIVASYKGYSEIEVMINAFLSQKKQNWKMIIGHDGPDSKMEQIVSRYTKKHDNIMYFNSEKRMNLWGHNLRNMAMKMVDTEWLIHTNDDNYYVPTFTQEIDNTSRQGNVDVITYNCIHSYFNYISFKPMMKKSKIDMGQFAIKTKIANQIKFIESKPSADGDFINEVVRDFHPKVKYINKNLFIHN